MTDVAICVVGHQLRQDRAQQLARRVAAQVVIDDGSHGETMNHQRAWRRLAAGRTTHACVIQDDALPIGSFVADVWEVAARKPDDLISLYVGQQRPHATAVAAAVQQARRVDAAWLEHRELLWGVAVLMPRRLVLNTLAAMSGRQPYDRDLGYGWFRTTGRPVQYTVPSLVDHDDTLPQITTDHPPRQPGRRAHQTGKPVWNDRTVAIA